MAQKLALFGGRKVRSKPFPYPPYAVIGAREKQAVMAALEASELSTFLSSPGPDFFGGGFARKLEKKFCSYYQVKHSVATDTGTAALHVALAALGIGAGDEVVVTPWSFSSSAKAPLYVHAVPVFADIEDRTFGLDPQAVEKAITKYTKAIIVVHIFGHPARMDEIMKLARKYRLAVIEDCAQAHGARYQGRKVGTIGDIGIFSLGASKHITSGEGGMLVTNKQRLAKRAQLIRNHGEVWGERKTKSQMVGILGWGYLLDEMSAALACAQMESIDRLLSRRRDVARQLNQKLAEFEFLSTPVVEKGCIHSYYIYPLKFDEKKAGINIHRFVEALNAEGIPTAAGYVKPLYRNPVYRWRVFYGKSRFPYNEHPRRVRYRPGDYPVVERLHRHEVINAMWAHPLVGKKEIDDIARAIRKVADRFDDLRP